MADEVLRLESVCKGYDAPGGRLSILNGVDLSVSRGEVISIRGRSGCGKSTLLSVAALLLSPDSGRICYCGRDVSALSGKEIERLRLESMGFVFQSSILLEDFSAEENAAMPLPIKGAKRKEAFSRADSLLAGLSLLDRKDHRPGTLSGGERQRVAIARALALSPDIIFADEPTGSLDEKTALAVESLLLDAVRASGSALVYATHNSEFALRADRALMLTEGVLVG